MLVLQDDREGGIVGVEFILGQGDHQGRLHAINMNPITISQQTMRRFVLGKQGLWPGRRWKGKKGTAQAIRACEGYKVRECAW